MSKEGNMDERIKAVMANVFNVAMADLNDNSSPEQIDTWDSLTHMNLMVALEEEFEVKFDDDHILQINDFGSICDVLVRLKDRELNDDN
jgi:acyl carrier protein